MKRNEKGYSLIELIVTLAVFSILMVALIMMLRTSMASYREGLFETEMQEEVQITANQVSEFLIDAYSFDKQVANHDIGGGVKVDAYSFNGPDGDFTLVYSPSEHSLFYYEKKFDDIDWSNTNKIYRNLVSDKVYDTSEGKGFAIVGLNKRSSKDDKNFQDNEATIKVNIESHGRSYAAEKDVYFRNNIEDSIPKVEADDPDNYMTFAAENMDIEDNVSTGGVHDVALMRYDELDLSREFGIVYGVNSDDYNGKGFIMINPDAPGKAIGNGVNNEISNTFKAASKDGYFPQEKLHTFWWKTDRKAYRCVWGDKTTSTAEDLIQFLTDNDVVFCAKFATPNTYQLTPQIIKTLKGINNIWSDANGNIEIKFWKH